MNSESTEEMRKWSRPSPQRLPAMLAAALLALAASSGSGEQQAAAPSSLDCRLDCASSRTSSQVRVQFMV